MSTKFVPSSIVQCTPCPCTDLHCISMDIKKLEGGFDKSPRCYLSRSMPSWAEPECPKPCSLLDKNTANSKPTYKVWRWKHWESNNMLNVSRVWRMHWSLPLLSTIALYGTSHTQTLSVRLLHHHLHIFVFCCIFSWSKLKNLYKLQEINQFYYTLLLKLYL